MPDPHSTHWRPVQQPDRIAALDATRGVALLGILMVNMSFFFEPVGLHFSPDAHRRNNALDSAADWVVTTLCEGKFYPLFSLLFGMGMVAMLERARQAGRRFWAIYLRRLTVLVVIGFLHATLIWYGDILFIYALCGLVLLLLAPLCSARTLLIIAGMMLGVIVLIGAAFTVLMCFVDASPGPPIDIAAKLTAEELAASPFDRLMHALRRVHWVQMHDPFYISVETEAFRDGPFWDALRFRIFSWACMLIFMLFGFIPHIVAMFLIGAGLMKLGFFTPARASLRGRLLRIGGGIGLTLAVVSTALVVIPGLGMWAFILSLTLNFIAGPLIALAILAGITAAVERGSLGRLQGLLVSAGRTALSVYLAMSVIATGLSYHWGLRLFGRVGDAAQVILALVIWAVLVAAAHQWMKRFNYGPVEWLWRTLTYLRVPAMRRVETP